MCMRARNCAPAPSLAHARNMLVDPRGMQKILAAQPAFAWLLRGSLVSGAHGDVYNPRDRWMGGRRVSRGHLIHLYSFPVLYLSTLASIHPANNNIILTNTCDPTAVLGTHSMNASSSCTVSLCVDSCRSREYDPSCSFDLSRWGPNCACRKFHF